MPNQPTTLSLYRQLRNYSDNAYDLWKAADHSPSPEYRKAYEELAAFRDSIDPPLFEKLKAAQRWMQINHPYVFFNSTWSNCYGRDNAMRDYLGFSAYHTEPEEGIPFKPSSVTPKQMILDGFSYYEAQLNQEADILSAGGLNTDHIDAHQQKIVDMLNHLKSCNDNLSEAL